MLLTTHPAVPVESVPTNIPGGRATLQRCSLLQSPLVDQNTT